MLIQHEILQKIRISVSFLFIHQEFVVKIFIETEKFMPIKHNIEYVICNCIILTQIE